MARAVLPKVWELVALGPPSRQPLARIPLAADFTRPRHLSLKSLNTKLVAYLFQWCSAPVAKYNQKNTCLYSAYDSGPRPAPESPCQLGNERSCSTIQQLPEPDFHRRLQPPHASSCIQIPESTRKIRARPQPRLETHVENIHGCKSPELLVWVPPN